MPFGIEGYFDSTYTDPDTRHRYPPKRANRSFIPDEASESSRTPRSRA